MLGHEQGGQGAVAEAFAAYHEHLQSSSTPNTIPGLANTGAVCPTNVTSEPRIDEDAQVNAFSELNSDTATVASGPARVNIAKDVLEVDQLLSDVHEDDTVDEAISNLIDEQLDEVRELAGLDDTALSSGDEDEDDPSSGLEVDTSVVARLPPKDTPGRVAFTPLLVRVLFGRLRAKGRRPAALFGALPAKGRGLLVGLMVKEVERGWRDGYVHICYPRDMCSPVYIAPRRN